MGRKKLQEIKRADDLRSGRQTRNYALGAVALALVLGIGFLVTSARDAAAAPEWSATGIEGEAIGSDEFSGDVYVLDFFFLTCGICEAQLPDNKAMVENLSGRDDFHFVSITADPADTARKIRDHQNETGANWTHVRDTFGLYQDFEVRGNPNLVFVDRDGNVALTVTRLAPAAYLIEQAQRILDGEAAQQAPTGPTPPTHQNAGHS